MYVTVSMSVQKQNTKAKKETKCPCQRRKAQEAQGLSSRVTGEDRRATGQTGLPTGQADGRYKRIRMA